MAKASSFPLVKLPIFKNILDFVEDQKPTSVDSIIKGLQKVQGIRDVCVINVILIEDADDVNSTLDYLHTRSDKGGVLAYVRLYLDEEIKNTAWLKHEFPCPVVFEFCKTKGVNVPVNDNVVQEACAIEFNLGTTMFQSHIDILIDHFEKYTSNLMTVISTFDDEGKINNFVSEAFDEIVSIQNMSSMARRIWLEGSPHIPHFVPSSARVKEYKSKLVQTLLEEIGQEIKISIGRKLKKDIQEKLHLDFEDVKLDVLNHPDDHFFFVNIFIQLFSIVWDGIEMIFSAVVTWLVPQDINSDSWREKIASVTQKSLMKHRWDILTKLRKQVLDICKSVAMKLNIELRKSQQFLSVIISNRAAKRHSGTKLVSASYGTDEIGKKVIALRAENFDHMYFSREKGMDIFIDQRTVKESTKEMQLVEEYIDNKLEEKDRIWFDNRRKLNEIVRKYTPELMKKHSNLVTISTSPVISSRDGIERKPCIVIYCSCKGVIPIGERQFRRELEDMPVDVREGYVYFGSAREFHDPLRLGCSIGVSGQCKSGSVGVFVTEVDTPDQYGLLTCGHVLLPGQELIDRHIREKIRMSVVPTDVVQPSFEDAKCNRVCGTLFDAKFGNIVYNGEFTGVDYAYVKMINRIPRALQFPSVEQEHAEAANRDGYQEETEMGPPILQLDEDDMEQYVYKFGRSSGFTRGVFNFNGAAIRKDYLSASLRQEDDEERYLLNLYNIASFRRVFGEPGDSGASVFIRKRPNRKIHVIGLFVGGFPNGECFVTPIGAILESIDPRIEIQCFPR